MKTIDSNKSKLKTTYISILIPLAVAINLIGGQIALQLKLPLYLDAIGTVILSAIMGPWIGAISGLLSSFITSLISGNLLDTLFAHSTPPKQPGNNSAYLTTAKSPAGGLSAYR